MAYELFYRTYGHVGHFETVISALLGARARANETEGYIKVYDQSTWSQQFFMVFNDGRVAAKRRPTRQEILEVCEAAMGLSRRLTPYNQELTEEIAIASLRLLALEMGISTLKEFSPSVEFERLLESYLRGLVALNDAEISGGE